MAEQKPHADNLPDRPNGQWVIPYKDLVVSSSLTRLHCSKSWAEAGGLSTVMGKGSRSATCPANLG